jgi:hypothetical protein
MWSSENEILILEVLERCVLHCRTWQLAMKSVTFALATAMVCTLSNTGSYQAKVYLGNWNHWAVDIVK